MFAESRTDAGADVPFGGAWLAQRREEGKMKFEKFFYSLATKHTKCTAAHKIDVHIKSCTCSHPHPNTRNLTLLFVCNL